MRRGDGVNRGEAHHSSSVVDFQLMLSRILRRSLTGRDSLCAGGVESLDDQLTAGWRGFADSFQDRKKVQRAERGVTTARELVQLVRAKHLREDGGDEGRREDCREKLV
jgi:hypothetical protein